VTKQKGKAVTQNSSRERKKNSFRYKSAALDRKFTIRVVDLIAKKLYTFLCTTPHCPDNRASLHFSYFATRDAEVPSRDLIEGLI
jgi:hypothetical protein